MKSAKIYMDIKVFDRIEKKQIAFVEGKRVKVRGMEWNIREDFAIIRY